MHTNLLTTTAFLLCLEKAAKWVIWGAWSHTLLLLFPIGASLNEMSPINAWDVLFINVVSVFVVIFFFTLIIFDLGCLITNRFNASSGPLDARRRDNIGSSYALP